MQASIFCVSKKSCSSSFGAKLLYEPKSQQYSFAQNTWKEICVFISFKFLWIDMIVRIDSIVLRSSVWFCTKKKTRQLNYILWFIILYTWGLELMLHQLSSRWSTLFILNCFYYNFRTFFLFLFCFLIVIFFSKGGLELVK